MTQGEHIAKLLKAKRLSINKAADRAGVSREHLSKIINDKRGLGQTVARKIAPVLGVSVANLVLPKEEEVESRRGLERRLESLATDLAEAVREQARANARIQRLQARVRTLEVRPSPAEDPSKDQAGP